MEQVLAALNAAQHTETRKLAEQFLQTAIYEKSYYLHVYQIATLESPTVAYETKVLAAIQFKNGIDKFWRKTAKQ